MSSEKAGIESITNYNDDNPDLLLEKDVVLPNGETMNLRSLKSETVLYGISLDGDDYIRAPLFNNPGDAVLHALEPMYNIDPTNTITPYPSNINLREYSVNRKIIYYDSRGKIRPRCGRLGPSPDGEASISNFKLDYLLQLPAGRPETNKNSTSSSTSSSSTSSAIISTIDNVTTAGSKLNLVGLLTEVFSVCNPGKTLTLSKSFRIETQVLKDFYQRLVFKGMSPVEIRARAFTGLQAATDVYHAAHKHHLTMSGDQTTNVKVKEHHTIEEGNKNKGEKIETKKLCGCDYVLNAILREGIIINNKDAKNNRDKNSKSKTRRIPDVIDAQLNDNLSLVEIIYENPREAQDYNLMKLVYERLWKRDVRDIDVIYRFQHRNKHGTQEGNYIGHQLIPMKIVPTTEGLYNDRWFFEEDFQAEMGKNNQSTNNRPTNNQLLSDAYSWNYNRFLDVNTIMLYFLTTMYRQKWLKNLMMVHDYDVIKHVTQSKENRLFRYSEISYLSEEKDIDGSDITIPWIDKVKSIEMYDSIGDIYVTFQFNEVDNGININLISNMKTSLNNEDETLTEDPNRRVEATLVEIELMLEKIVSDINDSMNIFFKLDKGYGPHFWILYFADPNSTVLIPYNQLINGKVKPSPNDINIQTNYLILIIVNTLVRYLITKQEFVHVNFL